MDAWGWDELQPWQGVASWAGSRPARRLWRCAPRLRGARGAKDAGSICEDETPAARSDVPGVVARDRVNDQDLKTQFLRENGGKRLPEPVRAVLDRDDYGCARRGLGQHSPSVPAGHRAVR